MEDQSYELPPDSPKNHVTAAISAPGPPGPFLPHFWSLSQPLHPVLIEESELRPIRAGSR